MFTMAESTETCSKPRSQGKVRKRAAKACLSCRARKVRCDVSQRGHPCMNCYLDSKTCMVSCRASRFRRQRDGNHTSVSYPPYTPEKTLRSAEAVVQSRLAGQGVRSPPSPENLEHHPEKGDGNDIGETRMSSPHSSITVHKNTPADSDADTAHRNVPSTGPSSRSQQNANTKPMDWTNHTPSSMSSDVVYSYYPFLTLGNLPSLPPQDVNFLESQGCLRLPARPLLDAFVQQYFLHVHPMLPLIDEGDFWSLYRQTADTHSSSERVSLLVCQAILFASCTFVSRSVIKSLGFSSTRDARASLYRRTKLLYDLESESSPLAMAQAGLLLSFWSPMSTRKPSTSWLSIAIQHAKSAEAHHYAALPEFSIDTHPVQHRKQRILKHIWWCCIIRDRILSLLMRRPIQITRAQFDFDENPRFGSMDLIHELDRSRVYSFATKKALANVLGHLVELCVAFTDIVMMVCPPDDTLGWAREMGIDGEDAGRISRIALQKWHEEATQRFPMSVHRPTAHAATRADMNCQHDSVTLYTNLMYMYYHSTRVMLCHHELLHSTMLYVPVDGIVSNTQSLLYESRQELQDAVSGTIECLKDLVHLKLARWLPISAVACTALPLVLSILDVKLSATAKDSSSPVNPYHLAAAKQQRLGVLIEAMKAYQPQYDGVRWISQIVRHIVTLSQTEGSSLHCIASKTSITSWTDILALYPDVYLRLTLALDLSLSKGRLPEDRDFPDGLREILTTGYSPLRSFEDMNGSSEHDLRGTVNDNSPGENGTRGRNFHQYYSPAISDFTYHRQHIDEVSRDQSPQKMEVDSLWSTSNAPSEFFELKPQMSLAPSSSTRVTWEGEPVYDESSPDVQTYWIENFWTELNEPEDKDDASTAQVLMEVLTESDLGECIA